MAQTLTSLNKALKEVWTIEAMRGDINRQFVGAYFYPTAFPSDPVKLSRIIEENKQRIAKLERKGKPSYRQRQKNGKAGRTRNGNSGWVRAK